MNSNQLVCMALMALLVVATALIVYYGFIHKCKNKCKEKNSGVLLLGTESGKFLHADGTMRNDTSEDAVFQISDLNKVSPAIESYNWSIKTVNGVSVLYTTDPSFGTVLMDVSKSPVGGKPQSIEAGLNDRDCQLAVISASSCDDS